MTSKGFIPVTVVVTTSITTVAAGSIAFQVIKQVELANTVRFLEANQQYAVIFQDGSFLMNNVLDGAIIRQVEAGSCRHIDYVIPFSPRPGKVCTAKDFASTVSMQ